jgi:hypothetical protein
MQTPPASSDFLATWLIHAESSWASYHLYELTRAEPERAWACVETLCAEGLSERERDELCRTVGDLMRAHGERFIDRAERLAAENETFRKCLRKAVWSSGDTELEQRARAAARIRWTLGGRTDA